jgi:hypothetical protein
MVVKNIVGVMTVVGVMTAVKNIVGVMTGVMTDVIHAVVMVDAMTSSLV